MRWRREISPVARTRLGIHQPLGFRRRLIAWLAARGLRIAAPTCRKHANFFIADDGGSADDVFALMREVRRRVRDVHGIELTAETKLVGFPEGL